MAEAPPIHLALDAGQTGIKARLTQLGQAPMTSERPGVRTDLPLLPQLAAAIEAALDDVERSGAVVSIGCSGLTGNDDAAALARLLSWPTRVVLAHDSVTSFLGALNGHNGAVVAAGTGVVTLAVGATEVARVDGWGHIMGDAGSGYWIGREALDAVMRAYDRRGTDTALKLAVRERWAELDTAYIELQARPDRVQVVASFAQDVARLADEDPIAAEITERAATELVRSVTAAIEQVRLADEVLPVAAIGGVFQSQRLARSFAQQLSTAGSQLRLQSASGTGLDGAELLASLDERHPLSKHISISDPRHS